MEFKLESEFEPTGDQPQAIRSLVDGINKGERAQDCLVLLDRVKHLPWPMLFNK